MDCTRSDFYLFATGGELFPSVMVSRVCCIASGRGGRALQSSLSVLSQSSEVLLFHFLSPSCLLLQLTGLKRRPLLPRVALAVPVLGLGHGSKAGHLSRMSCNRRGLEYFTKDEGGGDEKREGRRKTGEEMKDQGVCSWRPFFPLTFL